MDDIRAKLDKVENEQYRSIPAQRLIEKLSLLKNKVEESKKRWFWELLQNASDYNETVNVKLIISDTRVSFSHDGNPFSFRDAFNLISPDSNKLDDEIHKDNIGKFGTGLVSTHILSSVLEIKGVCIDSDTGATYQFGVSLDRSCFTNKQALIEQITTANEELKRSLIPHKVECGFNASFSYTLGSPLPTVPAVQSSDIDLNYLYEALPYTLCFMPKVQSVVIEDNRGIASVKTFKISRDIVKNEVLTFIVETDSKTTTQQFVYLSHGEVSTTFRCEDNRILPFQKDLSRIFCGLPLVGTEDIGMPFLLNSLKFTPTTEREGVELQPSSNDVNRSLFLASTELYGMVLDYVANNQLKCAFNIARLRSKYNGNSISNQQFYSLYLTKYKQHILSHNIVVNTKNQFVSFSSIILPFADSKPDVELYNNCELLNKLALPIADDYLAWFEATDFTIFKEQKFTSENLAKQIEAKNDIYSIGVNKEDILSWLYGCAEYLKGKDRFIFSKYNLLPNQSGLLCSASSKLYADIELPIELKEVYDTLFASKKQKIGDKLLDKKFNGLELLNSEFTLEMLANEIDQELSQQYSQNQGNAHLLSSVLNNLYKWIDCAKVTKEKLASYFHWYYPKRATLIVDLLSENQREQALIIAQSGKMESLAALASSEISDEELKIIVANFKKLPSALALLSDVVNDTAYADSTGGDIGEEIVYRNLQQKYPRTQGYNVVWASRDRKEPCYDFEITLNGQIYCYCDAKTTKRGINNADSIPFYMRKSQWVFLKSLDGNTPYYIARVFSADNNRIEYLRISV